VSRHAFRRRATTKSAATRRIRASDVRAADLKEEPTKRLTKTDPILRHNRFVGSDEDGGSRANIAASGASNQTQRASASGAIKHGSRAVVLRRSEPTRFSSASDDEVGGYQARSAWSERQRAEQSNTAGKVGHRERSGP
jgi:hypothetical protein